MVDLNPDVVHRVLSVVDRGLSHGIGKPIPGRMCVEAAVCYALGLEHGDDPKCVHQMVRKIKIILNDSEWSSRKSRAAGLRRLSVLQLGTSDIDFDERFFCKQLLLRFARVFLSEILGVEDLRGVRTVGEVDDILRRFDPKGLHPEAWFFRDRTMRSIWIAREGMNYSYLRATLAIVRLGRTIAISPRFSGIGSKSFLSLIFQNKHDRKLFAMCDIVAETLIEMKVPAVQYLDLM